VTIDLFNETEDPTSLLEITQITTNGSAFALAGGPQLPVSIAGDTTSIRVVVRFAPSVNGVQSGQLRIVSSNAGNSPRIVGLDGDTCHPEAVNGQFIVHFDQEAFVAEPPEEGPLSAFEFRDNRLRDALGRSGVVFLRKVLPTFTPESVHRFNQLGEAVTLIDLSKLYVAELAIPDQQSGLAIANISNREGVLYAQHDYIGHVGAAPNDSLFPHEWTLQNTGAVFPLSKPDVDVDAPEVWNYSSGSGVWIAIMDTGVDSPHVDLAPRVRNGGSYVGSGPPSDHCCGGHGTAVAGIAGASANNTRGIAGTAWGATLAAIRVCGVSSCIGSNIANGIQEAIDRGHPILNCSFETQSFGTMEYNVFSNAATMGAFVVAIMGNAGLNVQRYPARFRYLTFAVGAVWMDGLRWDDRRIPGIPSGFSGSNYGSWIDVAAPGGRHVPSTAFRSPTYQDDYFFTGADPDSVELSFGGTSAAAPVVSGIGALIKSTNPSLDGSDLSEIISRTAMDVWQHGVGFDDSTGWGIPRADAAWWYVNASSKAVEQRQVTPLVVNQTTQTRCFINWTSVPTGCHPTTVYTLEATVGFQTAFVQPPDLWYRTSGTVGIHDTTSVDRFEEPPSYAKVVSVGTNQVKLRTFVYFVHGQWIPPTVTGPGDARIAFTAVGRVSPPIAVEPATTVALQTSRVLAAPNPAPGWTKFLMEGPNSSSPFSLRIYDSGGRLVRILWSESGAAQKAIAWDGRDGRGHQVAAGVYFYEADVDGGVRGRSPIVIVR
jgi:hypothetical protein